MWVGDEEGAAFGVAYSEVADTARTALGSVVEELAALGEGLAAMAENYERIDEAAADAFLDILER